MLSQHKKIETLDNLGERHGDLIVRQMLKHLTHQRNVAVRQVTLTHVQNNELHIGIPVLRSVELNQRGHDVACNVAPATGSELRTDGEVSASQVDHVR